MLRALFVIAIILIGLRQSMKGPFYALLFYLWIAYLRPEHWLWWDFFSQLNLSFIIGVFVLGATLMQGRKLHMGNGTVLMLLMAGQALFSTMFSDRFDYAFRYWEDFAKSTVISVLMVSLVDSEKKLRATLTVIALSVGLEATKQGWGQLVLNPGAGNQNAVAVFGDNNGVAVGMLMLTAILMALARTSGWWKYEKHVFRFMAVGTVYRAISTYSRGGFLAAGALTVHYLLRSRSKVPALIGVALVAGLLYSVLPDSFWERMNTIPRGQEDAESASEQSIAGRMHAWQVAIAMANANPLTGVGHNAYNVFFDRYDFSGGKFGTGMNVHSSWFGVLAEEGYPGFIIFVCLMINMFVTCRRAQRLARRHTELKDLGAYAAGIESAFVAFAVGGSFVIFQYSEMLWHLLALSIVVGRLVKERAAAIEDAAGHAPAIQVKPAPALTPAVARALPLPPRPAARRA